MRCPSALSIMLYLIALVAFAAEQGPRLFFDAQPLNSLSVLLKIGSSEISHHNTSLSNDSLKAPHPMLVFLVHCKVLREALYLVCQNGNCINTTGPIVSARKRI